MEPDRWQELREAAAAANSEADWYSATLITGCLVASFGDAARRDAPFIAAASPDVVLSLLGEVEEEHNGHGAFREINGRRADDLDSILSTVTLNATQPGFDEHSDSRNATPQPRASRTPVGQADNGEGKQ